MFQRIFNLGQNQALVRVPTVKLKTDWPKPNLLEPAMDDVQCRHLLRNEENGLSVVHRSSNYICNGL